MADALMKARVPTTSYAWLAGPLSVVGFVVAYRHMSRSQTARLIENVAESRNTSSGAFGLWWILIGAVGAFALGMTLFLATWLASAIRDTPSSCRRRLVFDLILLSVIVVAVAVLGLKTGTTGEPELAGRLTKDVRPVSAISVLCAWPGFAAFVVIRVSCRAVPQLAGPDAVETVRRLRSLNQRLLATFGAFLTLIVVATGMRRRAILNLFPSLDVPAEQVLLYGAALALVLGFFYVSSANAVDAQANHILNTYAPIPPPDSVDLSDQVKRRNSLAEIVGAEGPWKAFQASVLIAAPLLSALIGIATSS